MNFMNYPKAILFDLDGVILDTERIYFKLMFEHNKQNNLYFSKEFYINNILGKSMSQISDILKDIWKEKYNEEEYWISLLERRKEYLDTHSINIKKGFKKLFNFLKLNNYYIGIVSSNSLQSVRKLLESAKIDANDFDFIVTRDDVERVKPFPDLYNLAVKKLKIDKKSILAIEDSKVGVQAAIAADINVINIKDIDVMTEELNNKILTTVGNLSEIIKILKER